MGQLKGEEAINARVDRVKGRHQKQAAAPHSDAEHIPSS